MSLAQNDSRSDEESSGKVVLRVPACDNCKLRKIKCDRNKPCSSCVASKIPCRTTKRPPEKRHRVLLSKNYGDELSDVNRRLSDLSSTINSLVEANKLVAAQVSSASPAVHTITTQAPSTKNDRSKEDQQETHFEGDSSFTSHSKTITEALGATLGHSPYSSNAAGTPSSANSTVQKLLEDVAASTRTQPVTSTQISHYPELSHRSLPPMAPVLRLLKLANEVPQRFFLEYVLVTAEEFTEKCQKVYFPTKEYSIASWIIVNVGLYYLFQGLEKKYFHQVGFEREEAHAYAEICTSNILTSAQSLRITIEATIDNVEALGMAASVAMELAKASLAWKLTASAARMLLDIGVHRQSPGLRSPQARRERVLFWFVYAMDKGLALNFGRTPNIHDYDLTIERPRETNDVEGAFGGYYVYWLDYAEVQGDIYDQLFSVRAQQQSQNVRISRAHTLAARCIDLRSRITNLDPGEGPVKLVAREIVLSTDITMCSLLTLIYRTLPPPPDAHPLQFSDECVDAAREALRLLAEAWKEIQPTDEDAWKLFLNGTVLFVPFVPFIVVFGNTIARSSRDDLLLLEGAVQMFRGASQMTPAINKLRDACEKFCQIAAAYLSQEAAGPSQAQQSEAGARGQVSSQNVDSALPTSMMGLGPMDFQALSDFPMQQGTWDGTLNEWDLGLGVENARDMTDWFGQYMNSGGAGIR